MGKSFGHAAISRLVDRSERGMAGQSVNILVSLSVCLSVNPSIRQSLSLLTLTDGENHGGIP